MHHRLLILSHSLVCCLTAALLCALVGCGTTRWSDTSRTATEQMLISDAVDRAISQIDFSALAGNDIYLESKFITSYVDEKYIISTLRQHMLASGCVIKDKPDDSTYIVEIRAGAIGTNRQDLLLGIPQTNLPVGGLMPLAPSSVPEIPLMKRTGQQGVCKIAVFAYDRLSGHPVWQSGTRQVASKAKDSWFFGIGPFQRGTIYEGTKFAGDRFSVPLTKQSKDKPNDVWVSHEIKFADPQSVLAQQAAASEKEPGPSAPDRSQGSAAVQAAYEEPLFQPRMSVPGSTPPALLPK